MSIKKQKKKNTVNFYGNSNKNKNFHKRIEMLILDYIVYFIQ